MVKFFFGMVHALMLRALIMSSVVLVNFADGIAIKGYIYMYIDIADYTVT